MNFRNKGCSESCLTKFIELIIDESEQDATFAYSWVSNYYDLDLW